MTKRTKNIKPLLSLPFILFLILALLTWFSPTAFAGVNMKDAAYSRADIDRISDQDSSLDIERRYNSRSLANGLFGFGWCSILDVRLNPIGNGRIRVHDCRAEGPLTTTESLNDKLKFDGWFYTRTLADGTTQRFDSEGKILVLRRASGSWLEFRYARNGLLQSYRSNTGLTADVSLNLVSGKIERISTTNGFERKYRYDRDDLVASTTITAIAGKDARKGSSKIPGSRSGPFRVANYSYHYDELHNLIRIDGPSGALETIAYDKSTDRVLSLTSLDGCPQTFTYSPSADHPKERFLSRSVKKCGGRIVSDTQIEFVLRLGEGGNHFLDRTIWSRGGESLEISYHPESGEPIRISRNGHIVKETI